MFSAFNPSKCTHTWSSGHTHTHTHTHTWSSGQSGEHLGVRCLAQGSHLSHEQFLPEPRFEPTTSAYKSNALSTRAMTAPIIHVFITVGQILKRNWNENIFETWCFGALRSLRILRIGRIGSGYDKFVTPCVTQQKFQYVRLIQLTEMPIHYITRTQNIQFTWASTAHVLEPPH